MEWQYDDEAIAMLALVLNEGDDEQAVATVTCSDGRERADCRW